jgi:hypothetical protein
MPRGSSPALVTLPIGGAVLQATNTHPPMLLLASVLRALGMHPKHPLRRLARGQRVTVPTAGGPQAATAIVMDELPALLAAMPPQVMAKPAAAAFAAAVGDGAGLVAAFAAATSTRPSQREAWQVAAEAAARMQDLTRRLVHATAERRAGAAQGLLDELEVALAGMRPTLGRLPSR